MKRTVPSFKPGFEVPLAVGEVVSFIGSSRGLINGVTFCFVFKILVPFVAMAPLVMDLILLP